MEQQWSAHTLEGLLSEKLSKSFGIFDYKEASKKTIYQAVVLVVNDILMGQRQKFWSANLSAQRKQVHYLSMEFLLGRSLKNSLFNLGISGEMEEALGNLGVSLEKLYNNEPDAGLGNGGLGRLAACYLDALASEDYLATGYSILYEFGMFKQHIVEGWQTELPDQWLPGGQVWLTQKIGHEVEIRFGGHIEESWQGGFHLVEHKNYTSVLAIPYDILIPGYHTAGVSMLRVWSAKTQSGIDMDFFNQGNYRAASDQISMGEAISKVLYPNDNHAEGKMLRLRQQYFLCAASIADICSRHLSIYGTLGNFAEKNAIHINDTHPTMAIPELMRFLLDDCGYEWEYSWDIVQKTFSYTNHTVMKEGMEQWDINLFQTLLPRLYSIIVEINRRFCAKLYEEERLNQQLVSEMAIIGQGNIRMANLAVVGSHCVNGVSALHSRIIKEDVFSNFSAIYPKRFANVTNGIASRRWLLQSNPSLTKLIKDAIGGEFQQDLSQLEMLKPFMDDKSFLDKLASSKLENKVRFSEYMKKKTGVILNPHSIFDVQVKRIHEYKRQQMNALEIIATYQYLKANPQADFTPRTYIFGGKAAAGYFMAKQIIRLICAISDKVEKDPILREKMQIVFLEEYNVTLSELLMPASEISQQISLAGTEASGTGNMKLMINGAITLGTLDGANVEIHSLVEDDNILIFGMRAKEIEEKRNSGYSSRHLYETEPTIKQAVDALISDFGSESFPEIHAMLTSTDYYMTLADFTAYQEARSRSAVLYNDHYTWQKMSLRNIAESGFFCADRAVSDYAHNIWKLDK